MNDATDQITDEALDAARSLMPVFIVAESPDGNVYSHSSDYPDDDTDVWVGPGDTPTGKLGDLYAEYGDDLIAYAQPEPVPVAASLAPVTAAQDEPKRTADGEVVINPDAPPDPKLALSEDVQQALNEIPARRKKAEDDGDTAEVEALDRYADALRSGKSPDEARKSAWADKPDAVTAAVAEPLPIVRPGENPDGALAEGGADAVDEAELQARARYAAAKAAGRSETEAREAGWPTRGEGPVTAAMAHDALDRIEDFLSDVEDMLGITASMNGTGLIPLPLQRQAVGGNPDAQAFVVRTFTDNYRDDVTEFIEDVLGTRPPDGTPDHDAEAWDALADEARLWHARQTAVTAAMYVPHRLGKGVEGGGRFAKIGDVGIPLLRKLLRGDGKARTEVAKAINDAADRGDIDMTNRGQNPVHWATKVFGPRPSGNDGLAWDAGRREVAAVFARRLASGATPGLFRPESRPLGGTPMSNDRPETGVPKLITRDDLLARAANDAFRSRRFTVSMRRPDGTDTNLEVLHADGNGSGYAKSFRTDQLYRFEQTGRAVKSNQVTVKVTPARDTGDQAGTLAFDGESQTGRINIALTNGGASPGTVAARDKASKPSASNVDYWDFRSRADSEAADDVARARAEAPRANDRPDGPTSLSEQAAPNSWAYVHLLRRLADDSEERAANPRESYVVDSPTLLRGNAESLRQAADRIEQALNSTEPMSVQHRTIEADLKRRLDHMNNNITGDGERSQLMQMGNYGRDILVGGPDWLPGPGAAPSGNDRPDTETVSLNRPPVPTVDIEDISTPDGLRKLAAAHTHEALGGDGPGTEGEATVMVDGRRVRLEWADEASYRTSNLADVSSRVWVNGNEITESIGDGEGNVEDGHPVGDPIGAILAADEDGTEFETILTAIRDAAAKSPTPPRRPQFDIATTAPVPTFTTGPDGERIPGPDLAPSKRLTVRYQPDGHVIAWDMGRAHHIDDPEFIAALDAIHPDGPKPAAPAGNDRPDYTIADRATGTVIAEVAHKDVADVATGNRFADAPVGTIVSVPSASTLIGGRTEWVKVDDGGWERGDADGKPTGSGWRADVPDYAEVFSAPDQWQPSRPQSPFGGFAPLRFADAPEGTKVKTGPRTWTKKGDVWTSNSRTLDVPANSSVLVSAPDGWTPADYKTHPDAAALERLARREQTGGYASRALDYARDPDPSQYDENWHAASLRRDARGLREVAPTGNKAEKAAQAAAIDRIASAWERRANELDPPAPTGPAPEFSPNAREGRPGVAPASVGGPMFDDVPVEDMTVGQLLGVDRSPDHIRALLKRGDLTDSQRSDLRAILDSGAVRAALDLAATIAATPSTDA